MKKLFFIPIILLFLNSCSHDEIYFDPCITDAYAYELLSEFNLDGMGAGEIDPRIDYFTSTRNYPTSMSHIKSSVAISLGFNNDQINAFVSSISINPNLILNLTEINRSSIKALLYFSDWNDRTTFWYESLNYWIKNQNSDLSEDFEDFFEEYGHLNRFPYEWNGMSDDDEEFHEDMNDIIESYPQCFQDDGRNGYVPEKYKSWLFMKRWEQRIGIDNINNIMSLAVDFL
jgi:hypothetical protein